KVDFGKADDCKSLERRLDERGRSRHAGGSGVCCCATPPSAYETITEQLKPAAVTNGHGCHGIVIEKPCGCGLRCGRGRGRIAQLAVEPPVAFVANAVGGQKVKGLRGIRPSEDGDVAHATVRGQYTKGWVLGEEVAGYREEKNVVTGSLTEAFAALRLFVDSWRWAGVPFYIRAGKRLPKRATELRVQFKRPPHLTFGRQAAKELDPNAITLRIQPDEGISLRFGAKVPSAGVKLRSVTMDFEYATSFLVEPPEAYERLLLDCMIARPTV